MPAACSYWRVVTRRLFCRQTCGGGGFDLRADVPQAHQQSVEAGLVGEHLAWPLAHGQHHGPSYDRHAVLHRLGDLYGPASLVHHLFPGGLGQAPTSWGSAATEGPGPHQGS